ncbi:discoidin domain-containing protein [Niabella beijingensis]|uniref:discoidin domain-containing protein n=1 Tax=Niabella beijingensis TaxID=2872700 RepID=UPI001CC05713|nr:discoidin domain-containing protein [Niabella beijingensis]MBZ4191349.1 discoidin domain-containing protein [Niabella beijingensis]
MLRTVLMVCCVVVTGTLSAQRVISLNSNGGAVSWKLRPQDETGRDSIQLFAENYSAEDWITAVVPGAVFTSYVEAGIEKDPNFGDNIYQVDKRKYNRNFWYRTLFNTPSFNKEETVWLNFEGINRKGELFLNGHRLGMLDGFMQRGHFNITRLLNRSGKNVLAVLVTYPSTPIPNHQSPTYISSDGWDWMPSVPGLLSGITDDVFLSVTGGVTIVDPWIRTQVPSKDQGVLSVATTLRNVSTKEINGQCIINIQPGNIELHRDFKVAPGATIMASFDSGAYKQLVIKDPKLWWPNGYGDSHLYTCSIKYISEGTVLDSRNIKFGIREYAYDTTGGVFHLSVNGERVFVKGGNWGMSEYLLRCRGAEYDLKVKLHKEMHLNMIRNWIGSVTDEEFYDACDKYGIMVWDDFWLNSHPNLPEDVFAFNKNAVEKIKRLRNHASIAVWCGDNEGDPLPPLNGWLRENINTFDKGDRWYQPNSHSGALTGSGPWTNFQPDWYFTKYPGGFGGNSGWGFRTEIGTAVFTTFESFKKFMPEKDWWPRNDMWDKHFFGKSAANGGPDRYEKSINEHYGTATGIEDFCRKAQLLNIETNKALYEGWQHHMWNDASGVMTWMSQSAYPSFVWQTYDYYYDLNGAYWGVKKACEPVHIQWNPADNAVNVINTSSADARNVTAVAEVYNMDGSLQKKYSERLRSDAPSNASTHFFNIQFTMDNLAYRKAVTASSSPGVFEPALCVADNNTGSRWSSAYNDDEWICIDLGTPTEVASVTLNWEAAYGKAYKLLVATDTTDWREVYHTTNGKGGLETIRFKPVTARYVKMQGIKRATQWGYSLYEMEVYSNKKAETGLSPVHFIKLRLTDTAGKLISDNFYWRGTKPNDYTALNRLPKTKLKISSALSRNEGKAVISASISNSKRSVAFSVQVQAYRKSDGERILPAVMNENYFTLLKGESKNIRITFDEKLLPDGEYFLKAVPYNP